MKQNEKEIIDLLAQKNYPDEKKQIQYRRRFMLLGQTLDTMRVWDLRRAIQTLRGLEAWRNAALHVEASGTSAGLALYASLFEPVESLQLNQLASSHREGPIFLNVLRYLDVPQAVAMAAERCAVRIRSAGDPEEWNYPVAVAEHLRWPEDRLRVTGGAP